MEGTILVTPEELASTADSFSSKAGEVQTLTSDMLSLVRGLNGSWTGSAGEAYINKFAALEPSMTTLYNMIMEHCTDLKSMAEAYSTVETTAQGEADSLPASTLD